MEDSHQNIAYESFHRMKLMCSIKKHVCQLSRKKQFEVETVMFQCR